MWLCEVRGDSLSKQLTDGLIDLFLIVSIPRDGWGIEFDLFSQVVEEGKGCQTWVPVDYQPFVDDILSTIYETHSGNRTLQHSLFGSFVSDCRPLLDVV